jgi:hypothetical protein
MQTVYRYLFAIVMEILAAPKGVNFPKQYCVPLPMGTITLAS